MRQVREVLRLKFVGGVPIREIASRIGVAASTVRATVKRFQAAGLCWRLPDEMTDAALEAKLFADAGTKQGYRRQVEPDWVSIQRDLKRKRVTLSILWDEYFERNPEGYRYSRFCELYRSWEGKLSEIGSGNACYRNQLLPCASNELHSAVRCRVQFAVLKLRSVQLTEADPTLTWPIGLFMTRSGPESVA
jgi:sigma-70-like protein